MLNVKDQIYAALCNVSEHVTDYYPNTWEADESIQYMEEENRAEVCTDNREQMSYVRYRIDIWHKKSTSLLAVEVDKSISSLGLKRTQCSDVDDPSGRKHKQMRYEMIIDVNNQRAYHAN